MASIFDDYAVLLDCPGPAAFAMAEGLLQAAGIPFVVSSPPFLAEVHLGPGFDGQRILLVPHTLLESARELLRDAWGVSAEEPLSFAELLAEFERYSREEAADGDAAP